MGCLSSKLLSEMGMPGAASKPRPQAYQPQAYQPQAYQKPTQAYYDQGFYPSGPYGGSLPAPFLDTAAPDGSAWESYVNSYASGVAYDGRLEGPWAECIAWCMFFELTNDWRQMQEYRNHPGPVQGVLSALERSMRDRPDGFEVVAAARRLEQGCREAARIGRPLPVIYERVPTTGVPMGYDAKPPAPMVTGRPMGGYSAPYSGPPGYGGASGPAGGYADSYGQPASGGAGGGFGKMAMAAAGGAVAGAGAAYMLGHAGDIADGLGDAAGFVGDGIQDVGAFAGDAVEDVADFVGDGFEDIGDLF